MSNPDVVTKYKAAAKIVNSEFFISFFIVDRWTRQSEFRHWAINQSNAAKLKAASFQFPADALAAVMESCKPGVKIVDLCEKGDRFMDE